MQLWNDFEGKTIAGAYPLGKLLRPEGRSAFFATSNGTGTPAVIRLTEALNDEHEMLELWRRAAGIHQENLVEIRKFGQTTFEGTPLTYAVMELTDAGLEDVLKERPLTHAETMQIATSLVAGLTALHENGLVHEHVAPPSVLAVGEVVKLRTDCVRECPTGPEGAATSECKELKERDVQDFALLLLRCLTLEKKLTPAIILPAPFQQIVANGISGVWGLPEIATALNPHQPKPLVPDTVLPRSTAPVASESSASAGEAPGHPAQLPLVAAVPQPAARSSQEPIRPAAPVNPQTRPTEPDTVSSHLRTPAEPRTASRPWRLWIAAAAALFLVLIAWAIFHRNSEPTPQRTPTVATVPESNTPSTRAAAPIPATPAAPSTVESNPSAAPVVHPGWYVVVYTYNHREQASAKVAELRRHHNSLHPGVFSPNGQPPYLVTLGGGPLSREQAADMRARALRNGLPRDTFARNY